MVNPQVSILSTNKSRQYGAMLILLCLGIVLRDRLKNTLKPMK